MRIYVRLYSRRLNGGKVWYLRWTENGTTQRRSTGCTDRASAELVRRQKESELADPAHAAKAKATLRDAVERVIEALHRAKRPAGTINMYGTKCGHLLRLLPSHLIDITTQTVEAYFEARAEEGAEACTMHKEFSCLSKVLQDAQRLGLYDGQIKLLRPSWVTAGSDARETFLDLDQVRRLLRVLTPSQRAVVAFIVATGARWSEAMSFQPQDLDRATWRLYIRGTKTDRSARTIIVPEIFRGLMDHVDGPFAAWPGVNVSLWRAVKRARRILGAELGDPVSVVPVIPKVTPNDLRRTFASILVQIGTPLDVVARLMGHTSTSQVYRTYGRHTPETLAKLVPGRVPNLYQNVRSEPDSMEALEAKTPGNQFRRRDSNPNKRNQKPSPRGRWRTFVDGRPAFGDLGYPRRPAAAASCSRFL